MTSSLKHADYLKSLGATHVLDRGTSEESLVSQIRDIAHNKPIELIYDTVGAITQTCVDLILAPGGGFILADPKVLEKGFTFQDGKKLLVVLGVVHGFKELGASLFEKLEGLMDRGVIKVCVSFILENGVLETDANLATSHYELRNSMAGLMR